MYSNGLSEIILGKAIKELNLPRDEIVVMTKVILLALLSFRISLTDSDCSSTMSLVGTLAPTCSSSERILRSLATLISEASVAR